MSNKIDLAIADAERAVDRVNVRDMTNTVLRAKDEIERLREDKQTCVLMLRALYAWLDGIGDGAPDASPMQREALWRCATITETLEKVGEL